MVHCVFNARFNDKNFRYHFSMLRCTSAVAYYVCARRADKTSGDVIMASVHVSVCLYVHTKTEKILTKN